MVISIFSRMGDSRNHNFVSYLFFGINLPKGQPISGALLADDVILSMLSFRGPVHCRFCMMVSCHNCHPQPSIKHWLTCFLMFLLSPRPNGAKVFGWVLIKYVVICFTCFKNTNHAFHQPMAMKPVGSWLQNVGAQFRHVMVREPDKARAGDV